MAIGERIKYIRNMRGMTQRELGLAVGFDENSADVRIAQYESGTRTPKEKMVIAISNVLKVDPRALAVPDIESYVGLAHTLFALEDIYGIKINSIDDVLCLTLDKFKRSTYQHMFDIFYAWQQESEKLKKGEITEDEYNTWRYNYPRIEAERFMAQVDMLRENKRKKNKDKNNKNNG